MGSLVKEDRDALIARYSSTKETVLGVHIEQIVDECGVQNDERSRTYGSDESVYC